MELVLRISCNVRNYLLSQFHDFLDNTRPTTSCIEIKPPLGPRCLDSGTSSMWYVHGRSKSTYVVVQYVLAVIMEIIQDVSCCNTFHPQCICPLHSQCSCPCFIHGSFLAFDTLCRRQFRRPKLDRSRGITDSTAAQNTRRTPSPPELANRVQLKSHASMGRWTKCGARGSAGCMYYYFAQIAKSQN